MTRMKNSRMLNSLVVVVLLGLTIQAFAGMHEDRLEAGIGFNVLALARGDNGGVPQLFIMNAIGTFNDRQITGGGYFSEVDASSSVPRTVLSNGTWRATRLISFTETVHRNNPYGHILSGILDTEVLLFPDNGPPTGIPATLRIVCNIGLAGVSSGLPEGFFIDVQDGVSYEPATFPGSTFPFGLTAFMVPGQGPDPGFSALADQLANTHDLVRRLSSVHGVLRRGE